MGFSSFRTQDTNESIRNIYTAKPTLVKILLPYGTYREGVTNDGYQRYGGESYFELLAKENGYSATEEEYEKDPYILENKGMDLFENYEDSICYPKIVSMAYNGKYTDLSNKPEWDNNQGYFNDFE